MIFDCYRNLESNLEEIRLLANTAEASLNEQSATRDIGNAMTRAGLVLLCGLLEGFVRELAEEYIDVINDHALTLHSLPDPIFCAVVESFTTQYRKDEESFKTSVIPEHCAKLEKRPFANTGGNPTVDTIEKIFRGLGIPSVIDTLTVRDYSVDTTFLTESLIDAPMRGQLQAAISSRVADAPQEILEEIAALIDKKWQPKKKRRKVGYVSEIEQLLAKRNRIAHGEGAEQVTPAELRNFLEMVCRLATGLRDLAAALLRTLIGNVAPDAPARYGCDFAKPA